MKCPKCGSEDTQNGADGLWCQRCSDYTMTYKERLKKERVAELGMIALDGCINQEDGDDMAALFKDFNQEKAMLTSRQRDLALLGQCPWCEASIRGYVREPASCQYHEERLEQNYKKEGLDMWSGHKLDCEHKDIKL